MTPSAHPPPHQRPVPRATSNRPVRQPDRKLLHELQHVACHLVPGREDELPLGLSFKRHAVIRLRRTMVRVRRQAQADCVGPRCTRGKNVHVDPAIDQQLRGGEQRRRVAAPTSPPMPGDAVRPCRRSYEPACNR